MVAEKYLIVVPQSLKKTFLAIAHNESGHQGISHTLSSLSEIAYWVGMSRDVAHYCKYCVTCQTTKALPAPLRPVIAFRPWELIAVDILNVPVSAQGKQYILGVQDYFSKWPFAQIKRLVRPLQSIQCEEVTYDPLPSYGGRPGGKDEPLTLNAHICSKEQ